MNQKEISKNLKYIKEVLSPYLGELVCDPFGDNMVLAELYSNGNVALVPFNSKDYTEDLKEYHAESIKPIIKGKE